MKIPYFLLIVVGLFFAGCDKGSVPFLGESIHHEPKGRDADFAAQNWALFDGINPGDDALSAAKALAQISMDYDSQFRRPQGMSWNVKRAVLLSRNDKEIYVLEFATMRYSLPSDVPRTLEGLTRSFPDDSFSYQQHEDERFLRNAALPPMDLVGLVVISKDSRSTIRTLGVGDPIWFMARSESLYRDMVGHHDYWLNQFYQNHFVKMNTPGPCVSREQFISLVEDYRKIIPLPVTPGAPMGGIAGNSPY